MSEKKMRCAIIGPGNIGMNLLTKLRRSRLLECGLFVGRDSKSKNLKIAQDKGYFVSFESLQGLINYQDRFDILFDATNADSHRITAGVMKKLGKYVIDLTPSKVGKLCIPCLNMEEGLETDNINMVTCGGQSTVPFAYAITRACEKVTYAETVSTIASASAGIGTRENIDDYIQTTQQALNQFTNIENTKSMIVLNPADPPIIMHNTLYMKTENPDMDALVKNVYDMEQTMRLYVPGIKILVPPTDIGDGIITLSIQVEGTGDYLPEYAGNLDIITCAAIEMAEKYAIKIMETESGCIF